MKVKICGLQTREQVSIAVDAGADYLGFVFAESQRQLTANQVKEITRDVPGRVKKVGVFVSPEKYEVEQIITSAELDLVQIHGKPVEGQLAVPIIQAISSDKYHYTTKDQLSATKFLLVDAPPSKYAGGNGYSFDWKKVKLTEEERKRCFIAGGLTDQNVQIVKKIFNPYAVDVSSGVEVDGKKDKNKMYRFVKKAKEEFDV